MTIVEFLVVYLSVGAPFGVLVFYSSDPTPAHSRVLRSVGSSLIWPLLALSWTHRKLLEKSRSDDQPQPIDSKFSKDPLLADYLTLTQALLESKEQEHLLSAELFDISGHPDPSLAAICAARKRNSQLRRRQRSSSEAVRAHVAGHYKSHPKFVEAFSAECRRLGDDRTADHIEQHLNERPIDDLERQPVDAARLAA